MSRRPLVVRLLALVVLTLAALGVVRPAAARADYTDPNQPVSARVADLLSRMTLDEKIGQMTQVERTAVASASDLTTFRIGSVLSRGGSAPSPNTATAWG